MLFYLLFALLVAKGVEPYNACDRNRQNIADRMFNRLSSDIILLDKTVQDVCKQFPNFAAQEIFGRNSFRLEILLTQFWNANFVVRVMHRVIYINAHYPQVYPNCDLTYVDVKILPEFVDIHGGAWTYKNGHLIVAFPYKYPIEEHDLNCGASYIDKTLIELQRGSPNEKIFSDS